MDGSVPPPPPPPPPPPQPPPHGADPKSTAGSGLPPGNYDIFVIPPHSAGSGFLYLPSLQPQVNSFIAGAASAFFCVWAWTKISPVLKAFISTVTQSGAGYGMLLLLGVVGAAAYVAGQAGNPPKTAGNTGSAPGGNGNAGTRPQPSGFPPRGAGPQPRSNDHAGDMPNGQAGGPQAHGWGSPPPRGSYGYQQHYGYSQPRPPPQEHAPPPPPPPHTEPYDTRSDAGQSERPQPRARSYSNASSSWQRAKEETKRREDERRKAQEAQRRADEEVKARAEAEAEAARIRSEAERQAKAAEEKLRWERQRAREKEDRERKERERLARERLDKAKADAEKARIEREAKERLEKARVEKELQAKLAKEKSEREAREAAARERLDTLKAKIGSDAGQKFGVGEKTNPYSLDPNDKTPTPAAMAAQAASKNYERPFAQSYTGTSTAESYRPYTKHRAAGSGSSAYSESYAPSGSTAPSTAPPSQRGPYSTTDPDKVVLKAVYGFSDSFPKPQTAVIAGQDGVTDGLILRIGTEGMFVDDDVRGIGLREWDVKTWTMKSVETISLPKKSMYMVRATQKDARKTNFVFLISSGEEGKAKKGVETLKGGSLARSGLVSQMSPAEAQRLLTLLGW